MRFVSLAEASSFFLLNYLVLYNRHRILVCTYYLHHSDEFYTTPPPPPPIRHPFPISPYNYHVPRWCTWYIFTLTPACLPAAVQRLLYVTFALFFYAWQLSYNAQVTQLLYFLSSIRDYTVTLL